MLARCHDTSAVQLVERPQIAMAGPLGIKTSGSNLTLAAGSEGRLGVDCGPLVIGHTDKAARRLCPTSLPRNVGSSYSEEPGAEIL
jgi:hypothetical protein